MLFSCKCYINKLDLLQSHSCTLVDRVYMHDYVTDEPKETIGVLRIHIHASPSFKNAKGDPEPIDGMNISSESIDIGWEKLYTIITDKQSMSTLGC